MDLLFTLPASWLDAARHNDHYKDASLRKLLARRTLGVIQSLKSIRLGENEACRGSFTLAWILKRRRCCTRLSAASAGPTRRSCVLASKCSAALCCAEGSARSLDWAGSVPVCPTSDPTRII